MRLTTATDEALRFEDFGRRKRIRDLIEEYVERTRKESEREKKELREELRRKLRERISDLQRSSVAKAEKVIQRMGTKNWLM